MRQLRALLVPCLFLSGGCAERAEPAVACGEPRRTGLLPAEIPESSGIVASPSRDGVFWTHNDSGYEPVLFAIDSAGRLLGRVPVTGAVNRDWEDIAAGPCPAGECLYIGDIGDNLEVNPYVVVWRVLEPAPEDAATRPAERFAMRYPDGPEDAEALFLLPGERLFLITKGRTRPATLYRYPGPLRADTVVELVPVQQLTDEPVWIPEQITGADATPDGEWIAVRTYTAVQLFRYLPHDRLVPRLDPPGVDLRPIAEPQGEGVAVRDDGTIILTSEVGPLDRVAPVSMIRCQFR